MKRILVTIVLVISLFGTKATVHAQEPIDYEDLFENHKSVMLIIEPDTGTIYYANQAAADFYGYSKSELMEMNIEDINTLSPEEVAEERLKASTEEKNFYVFEHRLANGDIRTVHVYSYPVDINGETHLFSIIIDQTKLTETDERNRILLIGFISLLGISTLVTGGFLINVRRKHEKMKEQKAALRESEERFKILHNASFGGIAIHDKGYILDCNQGLSDVSGYSMDELVGMDGLELIAPNDRDFVMNKIKSGHEKPYEATGIRKNGETYPLKLEARNIPYKDKQVRAVEFRDQTEFKEQEAKRQAIEEKFRLLHDTMIQGVVFHNAEGYITSCNPAAEEILGLSLDQLQGKTSMDPRWKMIDEDGNPVVGENHPAMIALRTNEKVGPKVRGVYHPENETYVWLNINAIPLTRDGETEPYQVFATFEDITEKRKADIELKKSKEKLETIMDNLPIGIAVNTVEPSITFEYMNDNFVEIYGVTKEALKQGDFWEVVYEDETYREEIRDRVLTDIASNDKNRMVWKDVPIKKNGKVVRYVNGYVTPLPDSNLVISTVIDVTDRKEKEEEILHVSYHDYLTGIPNRRYYQEQLDIYDRKQYYPLGMLIMDMNGLKLINDAFGHSAGNHALKKISKLLMKAKREVDFVARIGGDEFGLICPNIQKDEIEGLVESIDRQVTSKKVQDVRVSLAIGYAIKENEKESIRSLLTKAENNMYKNKVLAGNSIRNDSIRSILETLHNKFEEEKIHSRRVSRFCKLIGETKGLRKDEIQELEMAGLFHDIGKISIPDAILYKPEKLTPKEWEVMKKHTLNGYQILRAADRYSNIAEYAMTHHERIDGKGYPNGIRGNDIHLFAKIISVADAYEAMTSNRPYRKALKKEDAIKELKKHKGTQFDSQIVDIFLKKVLPKEALKDDKVEN